MRKQDIKMGMELRIMKEGYNYQLGQVIQVSRTTENIRLRVSAEPEICCWIMPCELQLSHLPYIEPTEVPETPPRLPDIKGWYVMRRGGDNPTKLHATYDVAVTEARRLAEQHQSAKFEVMAVYATVETKRKYVYEIEVS